MMISHDYRGRAERELLLQQLLEAEPGVDTEVMGFSEAGGKVVLHGCVGSYALKVRAEKLARDAGFTNIENCLRVAPGVAPCSSSTPAAAGIKTIRG